MGRDPTSAGGVVPPAQGAWPTSAGAWFHQRGGVAPTHHLWPRGMAMASCPGRC